MYTHIYMSNILKKGKKIMAKKFFILGIQSLISSENSTLRFGNDNTIVVPFPEALDELHKLSIHYNEKGRIAKRLLDYFSTFKIDALLSKNGVFQENGSCLKFEAGYRDIKIPEEKLGYISKFERRRIEIALGMKDDKINAIIISKNPAFRMKLNSINVNAQPFKDDIFPPLNEQYTGRVECKMSEEKFELFNSQGYISKKDIAYNSKIEWVTNLFLNICSTTNPTHSILARYDGEKIIPLNFAGNHPFGISAQKAGQHMALEALLTNPKDAPIVVIKGSAGTGKTILALACGLQNTYAFSSSEEKYSQVMITTPTETLREENLGFLPGELDQKFDPYLGGIMDNLNILISKKFKTTNNTNFSLTSYNDSKKSDVSASADTNHNTNNTKNSKKKESKQQTKTPNKATTKEIVNSLFASGVIVMQLIGHLRGRSITDTIFIIDEAQNIEPSVIKSIVTRAGKGSKFVFIGDPTQIDNPDLNERYNGLVYLSEKMKNNSMCWQVTLNDEESVRSKLAYEAAKIL